MIKLTLTEKLHIWRLRRGMQFKDLAAETGIHPDQLCRMEKKGIPPNHKNLNRILNALNLTDSDSQDYQPQTPVITEIRVVADGREYAFAIDKQKGNDHAHQ